MAAAAFGVELAVSARYGYVRDELYFLASGHHLALGGVDQPELTPLLARLDALVTGNTLVGLRALPALALAAMVLCTGSMARVLGADRRGQFIAALATACCAEYLGALHELTTTTPDFVCWAVALLLVCRLLTSGDPRWWLAIGGAAGIGMTAKWNIGFLVGGLLLGFACTPAARPLLRSRYLALGAALFVALAAPDFAWQAAHGWPNFAVFHALQRAAWAEPRAVLAGAGPLHEHRARAAVGARRRLGAAVGAVPAHRDRRGDRDLRAVRARRQDVLPRRHLHVPVRGRRRFAQPVRSARGRSAAQVALYCAGAVIVSLISLPVLPAAALARFPAQKINYDLGEEIGWPSQVKLLASVWRSLPAAQRARTTLLAGNYGEAGAVERYGASFGLPDVYSGANNFWLWGPPPAGDTGAVAINVNPSLLHREFTQVTQVAVYRNGLNVSDDEEGVAIYVATGLRSSWATAWPAFRDFS